MPSYLQSDNNFHFTAFLPSPRSGPKQRFSMQLTVGPALWYYMHTEAFVCIYACLCFPNQIKKKWKWVQKIFLKVFYNKANVVFPAGLNQLVQNGLKILLEKGAKYLFF
ncbi:uncharacterized protein ASCRUDRAFT_103381 [Ascoidea rubescens DSM 1968]|uniref:Uncharacterized protein n=1 Tax=Ascoidea rubescens DSM 1968 TaxID=1344418 RepID=A0A1D2VRK1_9ASCO|nr:hypothetical protein ASCRUDRAFT_103381 [Ascoidea rubescens DSM 1968]ODV64197.1 hypothetical protein ASCRUDRAFT_103381 [Ascoidea rubescens DSM 1968]